jgi:hypothetical protein
MAPNTKLPTTLQCWSIFRSNRPTAPPNGVPRLRWSMNACLAVAGSPWPGTGGYDIRDFVGTCRLLAVTPHVAQNVDRPDGSALDARTVRYPGYALSQWLRKRVEEIFGWIKTMAGLRRTRYRRRERVQMHAYLVAAAYNLIRIARLAPAAI